MAIVTKTRTYNTGDNLTAGYYNFDRDEIIAGVNSIDNAQISVTAGILESKLLFNGTSGHDHSGGTKGKPVDLGSSSLATIGVAGLTADYPLCINPAGTAVVTRLLTNDDIDGSAGIVYSKLNLAGSIVDADISSLSEGVITFDPLTGHNHDGVLSTKIPVGNLDITGATPLYYLQADALGTSLQWAPAGGGSTTRAYGFYQPETFVVNTNASWNPRVIANATAVRLSIYAKTAPTGQPAIFQVCQIPTFIEVATVTLPAGNTSATTTVITNPALTTGMILGMYVMQGGSVVVGDGGTLILEATEP